MIDYDKIYIEIMQYFGENFEFGMGEAAIHSEQLALIVRKNVEEDISNYEEVENVK